MPNYHERNRIKTVAAVWILFLAAGCSREEPPESEPVVPVQVVAVQRSSIQRIVRAQGILHPYDQAGVMPKISAPVQIFHVNRGDHVRRGQLLAVLENRDLAAAAVENKGLYEQAEASYRSTTAASLPEEIAKAQLEVQSSKEELAAAQKLFESRKELLQQGALARRLVDEASVAYVQARSQYDIAVKHLDALQQIGKEAQIKEAQGQLDAAKGRYQGAEAQLAYSQIRSPIDGVITDRPIYAGEMASAGTPLLTVMDISRVVARANVPIEQLSFVKVGNPATITSPDSSIELSGKVTVVSPALDPNSTTAEVWVQALNPGERLRPGFTVRVSILAETIDHAVVIPPAAVLPSQEGSSAAFVVGSDALAYERKIEIGIREADKVQVLKGLEPGEQVITVGGLGLQDKTKVRIEKTDQHD